ncbi:MAG: c-type cytochrome [Chloroflexi bacterium]|nr:c-type cytochrome [Chloroflexota bacterium]
MSNWRLLAGCIFLVAGLAVLAACSKPETTTTTQPTTTQPTTTTTQPTTTTTPPATTSVVLGGKLYDNWIKTAGVATPAGNSPLWATQTTNTRTGADTWRCKECHGWDYKGKDGAYGKGSHLTGFPGVSSAAAAKTTAELVAILKGSANPNHNFSSYLNEEQITALANFLKVGAVIDEAQYIDYSTKKPKSADAARGKQLYDSSCAACHGTDGKLLNFGSEAEPEFPGTIAVDNPWEFLHKVRFGNPGAPMPAGEEQQWSIQQMVDILAHAQTLPAE